jgi:hypothetical protein
MSELTVGSLSGLSSNSFVIGVQPGSQLAVDGLTTLNGTPAYRYVTTLYYTSSGTFSKASYPWLRAIRVKCQGSGGGGGGATASGVAMSGGGGAYAEAFITDIASLAASVTVTRGAGGSGGAAGNNNGSNGGQSAFGTITANGGFGGNGLGSVTVPGGGALVGGAGATTTANADFSVAGGNAHQGVGLRAVGVASGGAVGSKSGDSFLGPGGFPNATVVPGSAGIRGGGGGGGYAGSTDPNIAGLAGGDGIVIVELYA